MEVIKSNNGTASPIYQDALLIRKNVFVYEQKVPLHIEIDEYEEKCTNLVLYIEQTPVATCRLYPLNQQQVKLQRMAVEKKARKQHLGQKIMNAALALAKEQGYESMILGAQNTAIGFYEALGFTVYGDEFLDAGIPHHMMKISLI